jgi:hypothetical protein
VLCQDDILCANEAADVIVVGLHERQRSSHGAKVLGMGMVDTVGEVCVSGLRLWSAFPSCFSVLKIAGSFGSFGQVILGILGAMVWFGSGWDVLLVYEEHKAPQGARKHRERTVTNTKSCHTWTMSPGGEEVAGVVVVDLQRVEAAITKQGAE